MRFDSTLADRQRRGDYATQVEKLEPGAHEAGQYRGDGVGAARIVQRHGDLYEVAVLEDEPLTASPRP